MPVFKKASDLMGDDIVEISTETESLKNKIAVAMKTVWKNLRQGF